MLVAILLTWLSGTSIGQPFRQQTQLYGTRRQVSAILEQPGKNRVGGPGERRNWTLGVEVCVGLWVDNGSRRCDTDETMLDGARYSRPIGDHWRGGVSVRLGHCA